MSLSKQLQKIKDDELFLIQKRKRLLRELTDVNAALADCGIRRLQLLEQKHQTTVNATTNANNTINSNG